MNILLTSVGRRSYLINYFKETLNGSGEVHAANSEKTYATSLADKFVLTPLIHEGTYIQFLLDYCVENNIKAIISLFDIDLPVLSQHKSVFENTGVQVIVSDEEVISICNDKWNTYKFLIDNNIPTPKTFIHLDECQNAVSNGEINFPLIIKPRWGMGSISIFEADNEDELRVLYKKTRKAIERTYLKFESAVDIENSVIIQEKLIGQEYGIDVFNDFNRNYVCTVPKIKIAMRAGETDIAEVIQNYKLEKIGKQLSRILGHIANLDVDIFLVEDKYYVLEMNARFGGQYPFSHLAGVNFPTIIKDLLEGNTVNKIHYNSLNFPTTGYKDLTIKIQH